MKLYIIYSFLCLILLQILLHKKVYGGTKQKQKADRIRAIRNSARDSLGLLSKPHQQKCGLHHNDINFGNAYIITMKPYIPENARVAAIKTGFLPILFKAVQPLLSIFKTIPNMFQSCLPEVSFEKRMNYTKGNMLWHKVKGRLSLGEVALICSHRRAIEAFANDENKTDNDWALVRLFFYCSCKKIVYIVF